MHHIESLRTKFEDSTINIEKLNTGYTHKNKTPGTIVNDYFIKNQNTSRFDGILYKKDGNIYNGDFHIHLSNNRAMTGSEHTKESENLYTKKVGKPVQSTKTAPKTSRRTTRTTPTGGKY